MSRGGAILAACIMAAGAQSSAAWGAPTLGEVATPDAGVVGMTQSVSVIAPTARNRTISVTATQGARTITLPVSVNRTGVGRTEWTPPASGTWLISSSQGGIRPAQVAVSAMPTSTQVAVPTNPTQHYVTPIIATVEAGDVEALKKSGPITGTVVFREVVRGVIGEAPVHVAPDGTAVARLDWAPPGVATYAVTATFVPGAPASSEGTPAPTSADGPLAYAPSSSPLASFSAGIDRSPVQLLMPQTMRVGVPAYVAVHVDEGRRGSVSLEIDGRKASLDQPLRGDLAEFAWTPIHPGLTDVRVIFHEVTVDRSPELIDGREVDVATVRLRHYVEQTINVLADQPRNSISVSPVVKGAVREPWLDGAVVEYPAASRVPLVSSTGNGLPVVYSVVGSCAISGETLLMPVTGGGCQVEARAPGGDGLRPGALRVVVSSPAE